MIETHEPASWDELIASLWRRSYCEAESKWATYTAYRGLPQDYGNLATSLQRLAGKDLEWKEQRVLDSFRKHARPHLEFGQSDWDVMVLGRHHGLPTRMLDWSASPLVALFFATEKPEDDESPGVIWCVDRVSIHNFLPDWLRESLKAQRGNNFSLETLRSFATLNALEARIEDECVLFFEPPGVTPRIVNQYALFSFMPRPTSDMLGFLDQHATVCWKVIVPDSLKKEVRQRLLVMNISNRTIYPGLDGTASWLKTWYSL